MRLKRGFKYLKVLAIFISMVVAFMPVTVSANENVEARQYQMERYVVLFDPVYGAFPESELHNGVRLVPIGTNLENFPPDPYREGYVFSGWQLPGGSLLEASYLHVNSDIALTAVWVRYEDAPPQTSPSPPPTTTSPAPTTSPTPTPATTATPTPTPSQDSARPNPGTNPIAISFSIFGAVLILGIAAFSIIKLSAKHAEATGRYNTDVTRYQRESRLEDFLDEDFN